MCMKWFKGLFRREPALVKVVEERPAAKPKTWLEKMREKFPHFRFVDTSLGGPNMPKYQPCPSPACGVNRKRVSKTEGGANYRCVNHGDFFVRSPSV